MNKLLVAFAFLALNFYTYNYLADEAVIPPRTDFEEFPDELGEWRCQERGVMDEATKTNLGVTDYLLCNFVRREPAQLAAIYIGYHATQVREEGGGAGENSIHPPAHCLPGSGWDLIDSETVDLDFPSLPQHPAKAKRLLIAKGNVRQLVYYWYQSRGRVISEDWKKILYVGWDRAFLNRTDGSLIRFTMPIIRNDEERADAAFYDLAPQLIAELPSYVPN